MKVSTKKTIKEQLFSLFYLCEKDIQIISIAIYNEEPSGEHKIGVPPGSLILANVFLNAMDTSGSGSPVWHYKLLGVTHVEDRDQDGMEMQTV